jgi:hypothetical protein
MGVFDLRQFPLRGLAVKVETVTLGSVELDVTL